jgi:hypothetical protein
LVIRHKILLTHAQDWSKTARSSLFSHVKALRALLSSCYYNSFFRRLIRPAVWMDKNKRIFEENEMATHQNFGDEWQALALKHHILDIHDKQSGF